MNDKERLALAERQLDRTQLFFPRVDSKATGLFAVAAGELALLLINVKYGDLKIWYVAIPVALTVLLLLWVFACLHRCAHPETRGGAGSLVYFQEIAARTETNYVKEYLAGTEESLAADFAGQTWRNSEILTHKFDYVKKASVALAWSLLPFFLALLALSLLHSQLPQVKS